MAGGVSGGSGRAGLSRSSTALPVQSPTHVTTPSGPHMVASMPSASGKQAVFSLPKGTPERNHAGGLRSLVGGIARPSAASIAANQALRAGIAGTSPVQTALVRQNRPLPVRTFGMNTVVRVRQMPPVR